MLVSKVVRDGKVAVLVSPGFGAGWSTWVDPEQSTRALFAPELVDWIERGKPENDPAVAEFLKSIGDPFAGGLSDVRIEWMAEGTHFTVEEYDGSESIRTLADLAYVA